MFRIELRFCDECVRQMRLHPEQGIAPIYTCPTCCVQLPKLADLARHMFALPNVPTPALARKIDEIGESLNRSLGEVLEAVEHEAAEQVERKWRN